MIPERLVQIGRRWMLVRIWRSIVVAFVAFVLMMAVAALFWAIDWLVS